MTDENAPVSPDELVVRLVWWTQYKPDLPTPVREGAFEPKRGEADGVSVFRLACLTDPTDALAVVAEEKRARYGIVLLPVADVMTLGLSVRPAAIATVPGHAVLPELNIDAFSADKPRWRPVMKRLAEIASRNVVRPPAPPGP